MKIDFYNLQKIPFDSGLIKITQKAYDTGERIFIKTKDKTSSDYIDKLLWEQTANSWLPHDTKNYENLPILISTELSSETKNAILIITDVSDIPFDASFIRCLYVFNGNNNDNLLKARSQYKQSLEKKIDLQYHNL